MGILEIALLKYYRKTYEENPESLSIQEITEWLWLEYKNGIETSGTPI